MSARDVIACFLDHPSVFMGGPSERNQRKADAILAALSAAGWVVVPREPTREMWAAAGNALVNGRVKLRAHHDYLSETVWSAMTAASQEGHR